MTESVAVQQAFRSALMIEGAESLVAIEIEVRAFARPLGYDRFVLFSASATQDEVVERIYWVEGDWFGDGESVDAETYIRRCPVTAVSSKPESRFSGLRQSRRKAGFTKSFLIHADRAFTGFKSRYSVHWDWKAR
jgi:hypothetical protein